jgi:holo-[acyl-carrier protein] synthase
VILGVGIDLVDIRRLEKTLDRFGDRFLDRVFTPRERQRCDRRRRRVDAYAQRFAAKEACAKALGTGFRQGVSWQSIEIGNLPSGQPVLTLTEGAALRLAALTPPCMCAHLHVSMSDEYPYAQAFVVISAAALPPRDGQRAASA